MHSFIETSFGRIAYSDTGGNKAALMLVHGNSSCKEVFKHQIESYLVDDFRLVAIDLPGHGGSDNAPDATVSQDYTTARFASLLLDIANELELQAPVVLGWSLGGHVALEAAAQSPSTFKGLLITGTPPAGPGGDALFEAFLPTEVMDLTVKQTFSQKDALAYAEATLGERALVSEQLLAMVQRADGRSRATILPDWLQPGAGHDAVNFIGRWSKPIAVIHGGKDAFVSLPYLQKLVWKRLWNDEIMIINNAGHAPFLEHPDEFNSLLTDFMKACSRGD